MLTINDVRVDDPQRCYVIAEAAGCHNRDYATAKALVCAAAEAGADAVKFQTFTDESICADIPLPTGKDAEHDAWLKSLGVTRMRELFALGGLPRAWHAPLKTLAESLGLAFLSTGFSLDDLRFLVEDLGIPAIKIASGDITFVPLLEYAATTGLPILLSTGAATYDEIREALRVINAARGLPQYGVFMEDVAVLHCRCLYPCHSSLADLSVIAHLKSHFPAGAVGWSDHTVSVNLVPALAVSQGCTIIEKHLRLDGDTSSVDAQHSLSPREFAHMVETVRKVPAILGDGKKEPVGREYHERLWCRRGADWLRPTQAAREGAWE